MCTGVGGRLVERDQAQTLHGKGEASQINPKFVIRALLFDSCFCCIRQVSTATKICVCDSRALVSQP